MLRPLSSLLVVFACVTAATAQDESPNDSNSASVVLDPEQLVVPEGDTEDLRIFLRSTRDLQAKLTRQYQANIKQIDAAIQQASSKLLADSDALSDEDFATAAASGLSTLIRSIGDASADEQKRAIQLVDRYVGVLAEKRLPRTATSLASSLTRGLERSGNSELARAAYVHLGKTMRASGDGQLLSLAERFEGHARRLGLLGNSIDIEGKLWRGDALDWSKYQGKVVLVDFWATWCGPCRAEAPNIKRMYETYHDRGFDVVGISLDTNQLMLESYLEKNDIPWVNLFERGAGWKHPMAVRYGVNTIPAAWLINQNGEVVSLNARGGELVRQLEDLIGPQHLKPRKFAIAGLWNDAADEMRKIVEKQDGDRNALMGLAAAQILAGQKEAYAKTCQSAFERYKDSDRFAAATMVRICCLAAHSGIDPKQLQAVAGKAAKNIDDTSRFNKQKLARVLSNFRAGDYMACLDEPGGWGDTIQEVSVLLVQAMSAHHREDRPLALKILATADELIAKQLSDFAGKRHNRYAPEHWVCCAMAKVLRDEAQTLINPDPVFRSNAKQ